MNDMLKNMIIGGGILLICLIIVLVIVNKKENFFFEVSKCNPKCSGAFYGKPALFQFSGLDKSCSEKDKSCGEGMVCNCKYPDCKNFMYGQGKYPESMPKFREGI